ncbi:C6 finger domain protein [Geosmithia morbida]|uniref:C6 finger domain protein n=1 Tax=Geosmithia morbida TaxID=1094350 RepID=A0A9P4YSU5_9HYPO|nr:C6 finger domain protein [Geosmithia morbida]KAF4121420.1 C6 finger domain protein [Geosmithia morbida]
MVKTRVARSKTGCQSCRRRKVRCDEEKPMCSACSRLELPCSYEPGNAAKPVGASRYRVRFVNGTYSKKRSRGSVSETVQNSTAEDSQLGVPGKQRGKETSRPEYLQNTRGFDARSGATSPETRQPSAQPLASASARDSAASRDVQVPDVTAGVGRIGPHAAQGDEGHMPVFFDLNMNFDLLSEEWLAFGQPPIDSSEAAVDGSQHAIAGSSVDESSVMIGMEDNGLIQHYLNVMTQYTKIRSSRDDNIYTHIFSNMALFYAPLYNVIMAWTALHLGQTRTEPDLVQKAEERYHHAISLIHEDQEVAHHFELSLVTIWFALQFELLAARGVDSFFRHLEFTADLVEAHRRHQKAGGTATPLGPIGSRILIWLGTYDARAAWIGGAGRLLQNLELFCTEHDFIDAAFPDVQDDTDLSDLKSCLRLTLEIDSLDNMIAQLNNRTVAGPAAILLAIQTDLLFLQHRLESGSRISPALPAILRPTRQIDGEVTTGLFNDLILLAACYCLIISFHRVLPASVAAKSEWN